MAKYVCPVCGWTYDEEEGFPYEGYPAGTKWEDIPDSFLCPMANCEVPKSFFKKEKEEKKN